MKLHALSHSTHAYPKPLPGDPGATGCAGGIGCKQSAGVGKQSSRVVHAALPRER